MNVTYDYPVDSPADLPEQIFNFFMTGILPILVPIIIVGCTIGCTVLVWKFGPLNGEPIWQADVAILLQCIILVLVALAHAFALGSIVMLNAPILLGAAIIGFIIQLIEEKFGERTPFFYVRVCPNLQKIIVRKCGKDNSPHWSRCFVVISYLPVALLIAANCVWVAGLAELSQGVNWRELSVFFEMSFIFISSKILPKLRHTKVTQLN